MMKIGVQPLPVETDLIDRQAVPKPVAPSGLPYSNARGERWRLAVLGGTRRARVQQ